MDIEDLISSIFVAVIGLAIVAVIVSQRANSAGVISASGSSLAGVIAAAVSPVTGGGSSAPTAIPNLLGNGGFGSPH